MNEPVELRLVEGGSFSLAFLTGLFRPGKSLAEGSRALFRDLAAQLTKQGISPMQEKIYGLSSCREEVLSQRLEAYRAGGLDPATLPATYHQGKAAGEPFRGVQIWGVIPGGSSTSVTRVPEGRLWQGSDFRMLHVPGARGLEEDGMLADGTTAQARRMFLNADQALGQHGFTFGDVARTWIYIQHILDWYGDFNGIRNAFFSERGVGADPDRSFPASTGIQGVSDGEEASMDVLAASGPGVVKLPLNKTKRQGYADDYGSAFSRAMSVQVGGLDLVFVSGTASIDPEGNSIYLEDGKGQILETFRCLSDLLELRGAGLGDIHLATLFAKTPDLLKTYEDTVRSENLPVLPVVPTVADVCRDNLLVEIEALAAVPASSPSRGD